MGSSEEKYCSSKENAKNAKNFLTMLFFYSSPYDVGMKIANIAEHITRICILIFFFLRVLRNNFVAEGVGEFRGLTSILVSLLLYYVDL